MNFDEASWMRLLFLVSDTQTWIQEMERDVFSQIPVDGKKGLFRKRYHISASCLAHILERHYYKIARHPATGKFTVPVADILHWIREAYYQPVTLLNGGLHGIRSMDTHSCIGHDQYGQPTSIINIITDNGGQVKTAFPGIYNGVTNFPDMKNEETCIA